MGADSFVVYQEAGILAHWSGVGVAVRGWSGGQGSGWGDADEFGAHASAVGGVVTSCIQCEGAAAGGRENR